MVTKRRVSKITEHEISAFHSEANRWLAGNPLSIPEPEIIEQSYSDWYRDTFLPERNVMEEGSREFVWSEAFGAGHCSYNDDNELNCGGDSWSLDTMGCEEYGNRLSDNG